VDDATSLLRRNADVSHACDRLHHFFLLLWSPRQRRRPFLSSFTCPRKVRVGANSPSLWPTIVSVTKTGMCLRPSCTAIVWPSMAGTIIERRDHVLMTFLLFDSFARTTLVSRCSSTKGPFLRLRGIFF